MINKIVNITKSLVREHVTKRRTRSSEWRRVRKKFLKSNSSCAACGKKRLLQVHHCIPFNDNPNLELEPSNLIVLCMGLKMCHLRIGHGGSFKFFSNTVKSDASKLLDNPQLFSYVAEEAEKNRKPNIPGQL